MRTVAGAATLAAVGTALLSCGAFSTPPAAPRSRGAPDPEDEHLVRRCKPAVPASKVLLVLIDALRHSAVFPAEPETGNFEFVRGEIAAGRARAALSIARPPTVTLPRIKSIVTGRLPAFTDVLLNFFAGGTTDYGVLGAAADAGKTLVAHGDDTWHRTFTGVFEEGSDPVTSFFVSDYTEVDDNVTRHLHELEQPGWDVMILHYLGLDHVGHYLGPQDREMGVKERELDGVLREARRLLPADAVMLLVSDHGMTPSGNHGGASRAEVETVLVAFSGQEWPKEHSEAAGDRNSVSVHQTDIAPTLSMLLGLAPPEGSCGVVWPSLFEDPAPCIAANIRQLRRLWGRVEECECEGFDAAVWLSDAVSASATSFDPALVGVGLGVLAAAAATASASAFSALAPVASALIPAVLIFSSTYAEEGHRIYHHLACGWLVYLSSRGYTRAVRGEAFAVAAALRLLYSYRRSGVLASTSPADHWRLCDVIDGGAGSAATTVVALGGVLWVCRGTRTQHKTGATVLLVLCVAVRACLPVLGWAQPWAVVLLGLCVCAAAREHTGRCIGVCISLAGALRPVDLPALLLSTVCAVASEGVGADGGGEHRMAFRWATAWACHFGFGRSISLGDVALAGAFDGVTSWNPVAVGAHLLLTHYAGFIAVFLPHAQSEAAVGWAVAAVLWQLLAAGAAVVYFSDHLFVWSVFAPRYVFAVLDGGAVLAVAAVGLVLNGARGFVVR
eukprot:TRINITY_DN20336_c0_g1_i2.p1 TRINITY_DN20336_c0_g1~~TRINITY_DN20336_c0_g1_i2.p1  ORF type:complete len:730 (+),score=112.64 TRINITY_DN20336_c0_g1_i2:85-2274(+)